MNEIELVLMNPEGFNWTSLNIAEWINKRHSQVLEDIRNEIKQLETVGISREPLFQLSSYNSDSNFKVYSMYKLSKKGVLQIGARYKADIRYEIICKVEELSEKLNKYQLYDNHRDTYKQCMKTVYEICPDVEKDSIVPACKSAAVVNKVVATVFGFDKSLKKEHMTDDMVKLRIKVQAKYEEVFKLTNGDNSLTTDLLYGVYVPQLAETRKIKKAKELENKKRKLLLK